MVLIIKLATTSPLSLRAMMLVMLPVATAVHAVEDRSRLVVDLDTVFQLARLCRRWLIGSLSTQILKVILHILDRIAGGQRGLAPIGVHNDIPGKQDFCHRSK